MPSISKKLRSLGVQVGVDQLTSPPSSDLEKHEANPELEEVLSGKTLNTPQGETFVVDKVYPDPYQHGKEVLSRYATLDGLARWSGEQRIKVFPPQSFAFIDTESTGLSGGTGTYAFLIGVGRFIDKDFHLTQLLMRDPIEEAAQLYALEQLLAPCDAIVTFNGKSFDLPLLRTRYITHRWPDPFTDYPHIDLLHLSRRLWRDRLPSRTLGNLEHHILGMIRTDEDIPGWEIPQIYFNFLNTGDATLLKQVIYHTAMDIVSLAALFNHTARLLSNPLEAAAEYGVDVIALGKLFEELGDTRLATRLYRTGLDHKDVSSDRVPEIVYIDGLMRLARIHKRENNYRVSISLWEKAANINHVPAFIELAKYYEHKVGDYSTALDWTQAAINNLLNPTTSGPRQMINRSRWMPELEHRRSRLERKLSKLENTDYGI